MSKDLFLDYLTEEKKTADNTAKAYLRDIKHFKQFLETRYIADLSDVTNADVVAYLMLLKSQNR